MNVQAKFSGFSVDDIEAAKQFYVETLGCKSQDQMGGAELTLPGGAKMWMYVKPDHAPARLCRPQHLRIVRTCHENIWVAQTHYYQHTVSLTTRNLLILSHGHRIVWHRRTSGSQQQYSPQSLSTRQSRL